MSAATTTQTISIKNGENNLLKAYNEAGLNGKFNLRVDSNSRAYITVSNYKKLVSIKVNCYFISRTTYMNAYGNPSYSSLSVNRDNKYVKYAGVDNVKKTNKGYTSSSDFSYAMSGGISNLGCIYSVELTFKKEPDLKLVKVAKSSGNHVITIKNTGDADSKASKLGIYSNKKLIKTVTVPAIKSGKSKDVKVKLNSKYSKNKKTFKIDYNNKITEIYENNNVKTAV